MSSSAAINTFRNGDTGVENFTSMQQTILQVLRDKDNFALYNFECGNNATPGIYAGSILAVNYVLYPFNTTELALYLATDGSVSDASSAPDGNYAVIAKPSVIDGVGYCTIYLYPYTGGQAIFEPTYGHFIIPGTQYRVLALCTKSGSSFTEKRLYIFNNNLADDTIRIYQHGAEINGYLNAGYAPGVTDSEVLLDSTLTFSNPLETVTKEITHLCNCRIDTVITCEGSHNYLYQYYYNMRFRPSALVGENILNADTFIATDTNSAIGKETIVTYGTLLPGTYELQHKLIKRLKVPSSGSSWLDNHGTLYAKSTLYVGNVFGHRTGKIL